MIGSIMIVINYLLQDFLFRFRFIQSLDETPVSKGCALFCIFNKMYNENQVV